MRCIFPPTYSKQWGISTNSGLRLVTDTLRNSCISTFSFKELQRLNASVPTVGIPSINRYTVTESYDQGNELNL